MICSNAYRHVICEEQPGCIDCWLMAKVMDEEEFVFFLDSADTGASLGRYSMVAWRPRWEFMAKDGIVWAGLPGATKRLAGSVLSELGDVLKIFTNARLVDGFPSDIPPVFTGGAVGFFAYEFLHEMESIERSLAPDLGVPDCHLLFCDIAVVTDNLTGRTWLISNGWGTTEKESRQDSMANLDLGRIVCARRGTTERCEERVSVASEVRLMSARGRLMSEDLERYGIDTVTEPARYMELVQRAREHIFCGDVFELCLAQRFDTEFDGRGVDLYETMRTINPAPMGSYIRLSGLEIMSCSPERFLSVNADRWVETRPIKGTRPRGRTALEDAALEIDLATAAKDSAENVMIVDLARNDLGRICDFGTVDVPKLRTVERYPSVFQLVSIIRGHLRADVTPIELLRATFPGGSMTGAPKIEAMRLISGMEDSRRGVFSGALGYINYSGELDLNIVIRTAVKRGSALTFHTGGAVTSDSIPELEYQETLDKAAALVYAIHGTRTSTKMGLTVS